MSDAARGRAASASGAPALPVALDVDVRVEAGGRVLVGGVPARLVRLSDSGAAAARRLAAGELDDAARALARRLRPTGLAHPVAPPPDPAAPQPLVVVPVHGRPDQLERCLASLGGAPALVVDDASPDAAAIAAVCARHGARLLRRDAQGGPAAARNTALAEIDDPLVAFLDSDCVAEPGWASGLAALFAEDERLGAVAPRVRPLPAARDTALARYVDARFILDMGPHDTLVAPGRRVSYVPSAALVVRRAALAAAGGAPVAGPPAGAGGAPVAGPPAGAGDAPVAAPPAGAGGAPVAGPPGATRDGFAEGLQVGEDVDLVWRLVEAGWAVRYVAQPLVRHEHPPSWRALLARRRSYGTSAADLHLRHPGAVAPLILAPWPAAAVALLLARRPLPALAAALAPGAAMAVRLRGTAVPATTGPRLGLTGAALTLSATSRAATWFAAPALVVLAARRSPARPAALALLLAFPLHEHARTRARLDPLRWTLACVADEAAYGAGVLAGCLRRRTLGPLRPRRSPRA